MAGELSAPDLVGYAERLIRSVPPGRVTTFRALADALGDRSAARFVGAWIAELEARGAPVHRVVYASGEAGRSEFGDSAAALAQLRAEGVRIVGQGVEPLEAYFFWDFPDDRPLARLREEQEEIAARVQLEPLGEIESIAGLDIGFRDGRAVGVYCLCGSDGELLDYVWVEEEVRFPYVSGYLSWRELPLHLAAVRRAHQAGLAADVLLVDGNGILHPRRAGIASHLGVFVDHPTVGVAKRRLCGEVNTAGMVLGEWRPVVMGDETVAGALRTGRNQTLFVSPGHRADVTTSLALVSDLTRGGVHPPPIRWAHELAAEALA